MPKANLRQVRGGAPLQEFECSVCKTRFFRRCANLADEKAVAELKSAILSDWEVHLYRAHRRQWDAEQKKQAKREAAGTKM